MDTAIRKADAKIRRVLSDKDSLRSYQMREMAQSDYISTINFAKKQGHLEGLREAHVATAKAMKINNIPFDIIQKCTHLSMKEIERL
jgi:predicted transposase/invertase (TIGR01784 family)